MLDVYGGSFNDIETVEEVADEPQLACELYTVRLYDPAVVPADRVKSFAAAAGGEETAVYVAAACPVELTVKSLPVNPVMGFPFASFTVMVAVA